MLDNYPQPWRVETKVTESKGRYGTTRTVRVFIVDREGYEVAQVAADSRSEGELVAAFIVARCNERG